MLSLFCVLPKSLQDTLALLSLLQFFTSRCLIAASNGKCSPYCEFPNCPQPQHQLLTAKAHINWTPEII
jgi:hypothetical protein